MCFNQPTPKTPAKLPEAPKMPDTGASQSSSNTDAKRRRAATGQAAGGTIATGSRGVESSVAGQGATLLSGNR